MKKTQTKSLNHSLPGLIAIYCSVFIIWTLYRIFFHNWIWVEESLIKGAIFLLPIIFFPLKTKQLLPQLGISSKKCFESVYLGIIFGLILGFAGQLGNFLRHGQLAFTSYGLSAGNIGAFLILTLITAFWEQLLFAGYFLSKAQEITKDEVVQVTIVGILFSVIHIPALIFVQHLDINQVLLASLLLLTLGISTAILKLRQHSLLAPILAHVLWGVTIFMFR